MNTEVCITGTKYRAPHTLSDTRLELFFTMVRRRCTFCNGLKMLYCAVHTVEGYESPASHACEREDRYGIGLAGTGCPH